MKRILAACFCAFGGRLPTPGQDHPAVLAQRRELQGHKVRAVSRAQDDEF